ncbi:CocE/NonD family hydrolase [Nocardioides alcanivorans]|uniref:CocE/NonD family hydrolase n=1 Tax=Nocardioides alcanivorans TaxID=2897352 RepID=UPI001F3E157B|nr:CocE/NonD family hydrolase [Nocardioides alcanivorans]
MSGSHAAPSSKAFWLGDVATPMRDAVNLQADVWHHGEPRPAVLFRTPYGRRAITSDVLRPVDCLHGGFAAVCQDTRGRFGSDGAWEPIMWELEALDAYDTVEWVARQEWCDGRVILAGTSYGGIVSFLGAAQQPPSLAGVAAAMVTSGSRDLQELGGAMRLEQVVSWLLYMAADWMRRHPDVADPETIATLRALLLDPEPALSALPLAEGPLAKLRGFPIDIPALLAGQVPTTPEWEAASVEVPVFVTTGWFDVFSSATIDVFREAVRTHPELPHRLVVGPWAHTGPLPHHTAERNFGITASAGAAMVPALQLGFFEDPAAAAGQHEVRYFLMGADLWRTADAWPPRGAREQVLHLGQTSDGSGALMTSPGPDDLTERYRYDPADPVPSRGGRVIHLGRSTPGPIESSWQLDRADVLSYLTPALDEPWDVAGGVRADLTVSIDQPDTDLVVRLVDLWPDGRVYPVAEGVTRLSHAVGSVTAGAPVRASISLGYAAQRFERGHRLGLLVTSSAFPHIDRNLNTGKPSSTSAEARVVAVDVHLSRSTLSLDVLPSEGQP